MARMRKLSCSISNARDPVLSEQYDSYTASARTTETTSTPEPQLEKSTPPSSSSLSSPPSDIGPTPKDLQQSNDHYLNEAGRLRAVENGSPARRSKRLRKPPLWGSEPSHEESSAPPLKRRKTTESSVQHSSLEITATGSTHDLQQSFDSDSSSKVVGTMPDFPPTKFRNRQSKVSESNVRSEPLLSASVAGAASRSAKFDEREIELYIIDAFSAKRQGRKPARAINGTQLSDYECCVLIEEAKSDFTSSKKDLTPAGVDRSYQSLYPAAGIKEYAASNAAGGSDRGSAAPSPASKLGKPNQAGKGNKVPGRGAKANKGRAGAGGGRDRDSPDPPHKVGLSEVERRSLAIIRQRQNELRKFFNTIVNQQREALELQASRDLSRLYRKPKKHTKVPEYAEILAKIQRQENMVKDLVLKERALQTALFEKEKEAQTEIIESQYRLRVEETQREHIKGAQGDLIIYKRALRNAGDETRTNNGSDVEPFIPRYNEFPEPDERPRGYTSTRIRDEIAFNENLADYDEQAQREVLDDDIVGPIFESVAEHHALREAQDQKEANLSSLLSVTKEELEQAYPKENPQFALSRLADCAEFVSRLPSNEMYTFIPVAPRDVHQFPDQHAGWVPGPVQQQASPSTPAQTQQIAPKKPVSQRQKSISIAPKRLSRDEDPQSQSSSNTSTPLPTLAPAPSRMPPPSMSSQHHHHQLPPTQMLPPQPASAAPPSYIPAPSRHQSLAPLIIPKPMQASPPATPTYAQTPGIPAHVPPPPSPSYRGPMFNSNYPPPPSPVQHVGMTYPPVAAYPPQHYPQPTVTSNIDRLLTALSPVDDKTPEPFRRSTPNNGNRPRIGGPRREPGQITFTPAQTPDSDRFKNPPQPQPMPPGQAVYRPSSLQQHGQPPPAPKIATTFVNSTPETSSRSQQAASLAAQNAARNAGQGAGPKGGRRVLLPKSHFR